MPTSDQIQKVRALHAVLGIALSAPLLVRLFFALFPSLASQSPALQFYIDGIALTFGLAVAIASALRLRHTNRQLFVAQEASRRVAGRDDLTDAISRNVFMNILEKRLGIVRSQQIANKTTSDFALLLVDVDHFKRINDTFGHTTGDYVLKTLVAVASRNATWTVGRLGGDEFAILANAADHRRLIDEVSFFMTGLQDALLSGQQQRIFDGVSIGIAQAPRDAGSADALLTCADIALYSAKRAGRNQYSCYDPAMQETQIRERQIERELRAAILLDELSVHYQPIVDEKGEVKGAEALVRWRDPVRGLFRPPDQFIPIAERTRLIDQLGEWVFRRVCRDFERSGFEKVSINVSGAQLLHDDLVPMLRKVLRETGRKAESFILEITETVAVNATPAVLEKVRELRRMGFSLSLDDFGTGNCGFSFLRDMSIDVIKIDKSYVQTLGEDTIAQVFVAALARLGETLGFLVVAEGVETIEHFQCCQSH